jgi:hypothetical protein
MKSIIKLFSEDDAREFCRGLLESPLIRASYDNWGLVRRIIDRFSRLPRFFFLPTDIDVEAPHFAPWWGGVMLREYSNKAVQDLYYLHEMEHAGTMSYGPDRQHVLRDPVTFKNKIRDNEHQASVFSEMTVYCEIPQLREQTFGHEIFVDRFLFPSGIGSEPNPKFLERWRKEPDLLSREMMYARAAVLTSKQSFGNDLAAFWLKRFYAQGREWTKIWTRADKAGDGEGRFVQVERAMVFLREDCWAGDREGALERHLEWLHSPEVMEGETTPFPLEAREFASVYETHKQRYVTAVRELQAGNVPIPLREYSGRWAG